MKKLGGEVNSGSPGDALKYLCEQPRNQGDRNANPPSLASSFDLLICLQQPPPELPLLSPPPLFSPVFDQDDPRWYFFARFPRR